MSQSATIASLLESAELMLPKQVADILGVNVNTLAMWRHHNQGPDYLKIGGRVRYDASDVDAFKEACKRRCDPQIGRRRRRR